MRYITDDANEAVSATNDSDMHCCGAGAITFLKTAVSFLNMRAEGVADIGSGVHDKELMGCSVGQHLHA